MVAIAVLLLTVVLLGLVLAGLLRRAAREGHTATAVPGLRLEPRGPTAPYEALLQAFIGTYDLSASEVVRAHIQKSLRAVGVTPITPQPGDSFDIRLHNGVTGVTAPSPSLALRIVRVLRPGWRTDDGVLRLADVEVYKE
ncbi:hypothetical protein JOE40_002192 [Arthrobacter sp. PvP102]|uniref:nucleotide exchange factor GrpE n=1 Tax=unclassified Arthrobacter TaxID=235627 RepID=UPI001AE96496|nr:MULTISPECIES: nucleotide exchange factor GrpE [unclassified Arthrobacter]MBP1232548.1 hypothetical protein [Arthrobacter sp. PvP103]MBP1237683.1 hypothetical protein [Arthrobacter sp. PvP102]